MSSFNIAVVGATGVVGETLLSILHERNFPVNKVVALASKNSCGRRINYCDTYLKVEDLADFDFSGIDFAFFVAGETVSTEFVPKAAEAGAIVIDNTSCFRYEPDVPLVIPEVNADSLLHYRNCNIISNPNCSTIQMLVALKPIYDLVGITKINVVTYQSVSGAGRRAIENLAKETADLMNAQNDPQNFKVIPIAFNAIPHIDTMLDNGYSKEEMKMVWETQKILDDPDIAVTPTAVRIPVFFSHSEAISVETKEVVDIEIIKNALRNASGVSFMENDADYPTAVTHATNADEVFVGRVRADLFNSHVLNMWVVADNVRKGAALNAIQIAETLIANNFYHDVL